MLTTRECSICGMIRTMTESRSDFPTLGRNWIRVRSSMIKGKNAVTIKKDACAAYTVISSFTHRSQICLQ